MSDSPSIIRPPGSNQRYWREGDRLVIMDGTKMPQTICLGSGQRGVVERVRRTLRWVHPGWLVVYLLVFLFAPLGAGFRLIAVSAIHYRVSKAAVVQYGLSRACRRRRRIGLSIAAISPIGGLLYLGKSLVENNESGVTIGLGLTFAGLIVGVLIAQNFWILSIKDAKVTVKVRPAVFEGLGLSRPG